MKMMSLFFFFGLEKAILLRIVADRSMLMSISHSVVVFHATLLKFLALIFQDLSHV